MFDNIVYCFLRMLSCCNSMFFSMIGLQNFCSSINYIIGLWSDPHATLGSAFTRLGEVVMPTLAGKGIQSLPTGITRQQPGECATESYPTNISSTLNVCFSFSVQSGCMQWYSVSQIDCYGAKTGYVYNTHTFSYFQQLLDGLRESLISFFAGTQVGHMTHIS